MPEASFPEGLEEYYNTSVAALDLAHQLQAAILSSTAASKALCEGRVVVVNSAAHRNALGVILRAATGVDAAAASAPVTDKRYHVLLMAEQDRVDSAARDPPVAGLADEAAPDAGSDLPLPLSRVFQPAGPLGFAVAVVAGMDIIAIAKQRLKLEVRELLDRPDEHERSMVAQQLLRLAHKHPAGPPLLDPVKELGLRQLEVAEMHMQLTRLRQMLDAMPCTQHPDFVPLYGRMHTRMRVLNQVKHLQHLMSDDALRLLPEYNQRVNVLKHLQYVDPEGAVQLKGRVACEVTTCDELLITELIFNSVFSPLEPEEIVALLSALVFQEKRCSTPTLTKRLEDNVEVVKNMARQVATAQQLCGMDTPPDVYLRDLHFGLVEVVYEWARGMPFQQITTLTDVLEGSIVRCIVRLDETCRDVRNAARVIGDPVLFEKMERASQMIKRDIVFAASLYTT